MIRHPVLIGTGGLGCTACILELEHAVRCFYSDNRYQSRPPQSRLSALSMHRDKSCSYCLLGLRSFLLNGVSQKRTLNSKKEPQQMFWILVPLSPHSFFSVCAEIHLSHIFLPPLYNCLHFNKVCEAALPKQESGQVAKRQTIRRNFRTSVNPLVGDFGKCGQAHFSLQQNSLVH